MMSSFFGCIFIDLGMHSDEYVSVGILGARPSKEARVCSQRPQVART